MPRRKGKPDKPPGKPNKPININTIAGADVILSTSAAIVYIGRLGKTPTFDSTYITFDDTSHTMDAAA